MGIQETRIILVPVDFTDLTELALDHAVTLASSFGYGIHILHVTGKGQKSGLDEEEARPLMQQLSSSLAQETGLLVKSSLAEGNVFKTIGMVADELQAAFVVMGVHGKKGVQHLVGSYAYQVVCCANVPVLVVKQKHQSMGFKNIIVPIDFSRRSAQKVSQAIKFAQFFGATIRVFGFLSSTNKAKIINKEALLKSITDFFKENGVKVTTDLMINPGMDWPDALMSFAREKDADLVMIVAEKGGRIQDIFTQNYTEKILDKVDVPVLTIMPTEADLEAEKDVDKAAFVTPFVDPLGFFSQTDRKF